MKDRFLSLLLVAMLSIATLAACSAPVAPSPAASLPTTTAAPPATTPSSAASFPITVTDDLGRQVTLNALPERIVSLGPSNTEILFAIGAGDQVVGVTRFCNYPAEAQSRTQIGGVTAKSISVETVVSLRPDLVFALGESQIPVIEALERAGIPVFALDSERLESVYAAIEMAGLLTGHSAEADEVVAAMKKRVAAVTAKVEAIPEAERPLVFYEVWNEPLMTAGPQSFIGELIELAGGRNIIEEASEQYPEISSEIVIQRDPAVILGPDSRGDEFTVEQILARPGWEKIRAVRENRIYLLDGDIVSRPGPRLVDALEEIAVALYPDLFD